MNDQEHRSLVQRLFHESMRTVLEPLIEAGINGVEMTSSDGAVRRVHPILTCYVADYPEQCLVTCTKYGTCVKCKVPANELQNPTPAENRTQEWTEQIFKEARQQAGGKPSKFHSYCMSRDVAGSVYRPFWDGFPLCDIHRSITPDILHQLYQGVFKHLVHWCQRIVTPQELDRRIKVLPPAYGLRQFKNGISAMSQITGTERKNMAKILLGCLIGCMPTQGIAAVTALLDFIYLAQYPAHDSETLGYLQDALDRFHNHREYFIKTGVRVDFNIPKFHSLLHYVEAIELFGTTDNYNTEMFERLHIDFAKHGWRASNQRDEFPQMIRWLSRQEKVTSFEFHQKNLQDRQADIDSETVLQQPTTKKKAQISIAKHPNFPRRQISLIEDRHKAPDFSYYLKAFLNEFTAKKLSTQHLDQSKLPFQHVNTYNMFRFHPQSIQDELEGEESDLVRALPPSGSSENPRGRFDTVIAIINDTAESTGLEGKMNNGHSKE
jgi:Plavaka transposase